MPLALRLQKDMEERLNKLAEHRLEPGAVRTG